MPDSIKRAAMIDPNQFNSSDCESAQTLLQMYVHFKKDIRQGKYGLTQKLWLLYMDLIQHELLTRYSVQENNYNSRLYCWKFFHKIYFALNRTNYARYGSFYVSVLQNNENIYPGLKTLLETKGLSVQAQNHYPLRTAIDQRGEQTFNKDAESYRGIKNFANNESLNRVKQAENTKALLDIARLGEKQTMYKPLRPSQIFKSESSVQSLV